MFKKALSKLKKAASKTKPSEPAPPKTPQTSSRLLTAEGWKRLMMKKYRKSS